MNAGPTGPLSGLGLGGNQLELNSKPAGIPKPTPTGSFADRNAFRTSNAPGQNANINNQGTGPQNIPT